MFAHAIDHLKSKGDKGMLLWTLDGNGPAKAFYECHGMLMDGGRLDDPEWLEGQKGFRHNYFRVGLEL